MVCFQIINQAKQAAACPQTLNPFLMDVVMYSWCVTLSSPKTSDSISYWWLKNSALLQGEPFIPVAVMTIKSMRLKHLKITGLMGKKSFIYCSIISWHVRFPKTSSHEGNKSQTWANQWERHVEAADCGLNYMWLLMCLSMSSSWTSLTLSSSATKQLYTKLWLPVLQISVNSVASWNLKGQFSNHFPLTCSAINAAR